MGETDMSEAGILKARLAESEARIAELEAALNCPIGPRDPLTCSAGTCVECRIARARAEERERCARIADEWINHPACSPTEGYAGNMIAAAIRQPEEGTDD